MRSHRHRVAHGGVGRGRVADRHDLAAHVVQRMHRGLVDLCTQGNDRREDLDGDDDDAEVARVARRRRDDRRDEDRQRPHRVGAHVCKGRHHVQVVVDLAHAATLRCWTLRQGVSPCW